MPFATESLTSPSPLDLVGPAPATVAAGDRGGQPFEALLQPPTAPPANTPPPDSAPTRPADSAPQPTSTTNEASQPSRDEHDPPSASGPRPTDRKEQPPAESAKAATRPAREERDSKDD